MSERIHIEVAKCLQRGGLTQHWMLLLIPEGSTRCTWYHVTGGPAHGAGYQLQIQANKRTDSHGIASRQAVGVISSRDINVLKAAAQSIPMQRCQRWTVELLYKLEDKGLVPRGSGRLFEGQVQSSTTATNGGRPAGSGSSRPTGSGSSGPTGSGSSRPSAYDSRSGGSGSGSGGYRPSGLSTPDHRSSGSSGRRY